MEPRPVRPVLAALLLTAWLVAGCASAEDAGRGTSATSEPTAASSGPAPTGEAAEETPGPTDETGLVVEMSIDGDEVSPSGETFEAAAGEPVTFVIEATAPGELHVHSTPEQVVAYEAGTSRHQLTFDMPGVVEVESHDAHKVIVLLEVR